MLTDTQKARIRQVLGFPDYFRYKHTRLESVLNDLSPEAETDVISNLAKIDVIDGKLLAAAVAGGVIRVDEIWFEKTGLVRIRELRKIGRTYVARVSTTLGVPPYSDYFSGQGYPGDSFSGPPAGNRGEGGWFNLG